MEYKKWAMACLYLLTSSIIISAQSNKPRKIYGIAKEDKSISYYQEQSKLWRQQIDDDTKNAEAWDNYYKAERSILQLSESELWANDKPSFYKKLDPIIAESKIHIGDQFEYYYINGLNSEGNKSIASLKKAYAIDPEKSEVYGWLFSYYIPRFNEKECKDLAKRMLRSNIYSNANLKWNYNALQSVEKNGVIMTNGDMDGIPKWVLQYGEDVRPDVLVMNKWLLASNSEYREEMYQRMNMPEPNSTKKDFESMAAYADYLAADILKRSTRPTYISSGTPLQFFKDNGIEAHMYLVGNVLKYSKESIDNTSILKDNFENKYYLEYLLKNFQHHHEDEIVNSQMNITYLPGMVHLRNHYLAINQKERVKYMNLLIERIAEKSGRKEEVLKWFDK